MRFLSWRLQHTHHNWICFVRHVSTVNNFFINFNILIFFTFLSEPFGKRKKPFDLQLQNFYVILKYVFILASFWHDLESFLIICFSSRTLLLWSSILLWYYFFLDMKTQGRIDKLQKLRAYSVEKIRTKWTGFICRRTWLNCARLRPFCQQIKPVHLVPIFFSIIISFLGVWFLSEERV